VKFGENQIEFEEKTEIKDTHKMIKKVKVAQP
jgi:hypothetical protein